MLALFIRDFPVRIINHCLRIQIPNVGQVETTNMYRMSNSNLYANYTHPDSEQCQYVFFMLVNQLTIQP